LHALRLGEPLGDGHFVAVFRLSELEAIVSEEELNHIAMARACAAGESLDVAVRQWPQPPPWPAERSRGAHMYVIGNRLACEEASGEDADHGRV